MHQVFKFVFPKTLRFEERKFSVDDGGGVNFSASTIKTICEESPAMELFIFNANKDS